MNQASRKWWREPLLHFVLLGALAFYAHYLLFGPAPSQYVLAEDAPIVQLRQDWHSAKGASPSPEQEAALVKEWIEEEVLYRRAVELGIDQNDTIVRRRLVQRMRFLLEDTSRITPPSDAELEDWLAQHAERFALPERLSFSHLFFSRGSRGSALRAASRSAFEKLETDPEATVDADPFFRGADFTEATPSEIERAFGRDFGSAITNLSLGEWAGPVKSAYGLHLVRVSERILAKRPPLESVREAVTQDWLRAARARRNEEALETLRARYSPADP